MKKMLIVSCHYYPHFGGIEQTTRITAEMLTNAGIECKVICFNETAEDGGYSCTRKETVREKVNGIEVIRCGCFAKVASQSLSLTYPRELRQVMDEFEPDYVMFHFPNPYLAQFLLQYKKRSFKLIVFYHLDITKQKILGKVFHFQTIKLLERADRIIATSQNYIDGSQYLSRFKNKCVAVPSCVEPERLKITDKISSISHRIREKYADKTICFACGRHVPYKGLTYLIKASKFLDDGFQILIGGFGVLTEALKQEAAGDDKIEFLGRLSDEELVAYYAACDIFCFPSITKNEAFGLALAEAMYFGKPAVTFTIPGSGVNYVNLNGVTGIECPNRDSKAYAEALRKLAGDIELRKQYGDAAKKRVIENFTEAQFRQKMIQAIDFERS